MRIAFMGTPDFAVPSLEALVRAGHDVCAVYTQPPRPAHRGKKLTISPVHRAANRLSLSVKTPNRLRGEDSLSELENLNCDVAVVVAYGQILPLRALEAPKYGCLNIHASLLPRWRGAAPIHRAIMAGDLETGISVMQMEEGLDTGPILWEEKIQILKEETTQSLHDRLSCLGARLITKTIDKISQNLIKPAPQSDVGVTYAHKIGKEEARIDWSKSALEIDRMVRGLFPFPGAWTMIDGQRIKILAGEVEAVASGLPDAVYGDIMDKTMLIKCGEQAFRVHKAQRAGKGALETREFLLGFNIHPGMKAE